jgi:hypothetical protein
VCGSERIRIISLKGFTQASPARPSGKNTETKSSSISACEFVVAGTCLPSRCLATIMVDIYTAR